jgi:hypothetical protein
MSKVRVSYFHDREIGGYYYGEGTLEHDYQTSLFLACEHLILLAHVAFDISV